MHRDAVDESRRLKPEISRLGEHDIPIRHELEFELATAAGRRTAGSAGSSQNG